MAYKVFQNGFQLPASDLNNYLMNQSVISFASASARSAAITAPVEGMLTYLEDTNVYQGWNGSAWTDINDNTGAIPKSTVTTAGDLIVGTGSASVGRLGIGTNGQLLQSNGTTATWVTPAAAGGGYTLLQTYSPTTSFNYSMPNFAGTGYKELFIELFGLRNAAASTFSMGVSGNIRTITSNSIGSGVNPVTASSIFSVTMRPSASNDFPSAFNLRIGNIQNNRNTGPQANYPLLAYGGWRDNTTNVNESIFSIGSINGDFYRIDFNFSTALSAGTINIYGVK